MIETIVESIRVSLATNHRVVILKETQGSRYLAIWIGQFEAEAIALELQGMTAPRPITHDLLKNVIEQLGGKVRHIHVTDLNNDVYFARIVVDANGRTLDIDSRPSDAIALAVRVKVPIFVEEAVMQQAGMTISEEGVPEAVSEQGPTENDERLAVFRDFINSLDIDDAELK